MSETLIEKKEEYYIFKNGLTVIESPELIITPSYVEIEGEVELIKWGKSYVIKILRSTKSVKIKILPKTHIEVINNCIVLVKNKEKEIPIDIIIDKIDKISIKDFYNKLKNR